MEEGGCCGRAILYLDLEARRSGQPSSHSASSSMLHAARCMPGPYVPPFPVGPYTCPEAMAIPQIRTRPMSLLQDVRSPRPHLITGSTSPWSEVLVIAFLSR